MSCDECEVISLYFMCCSVNGSVCLVCFVSDSVCELFGHVVVVDPPLLRVAVEESDNPIR